MAEIAALDGLRVGDGLRLELGELTARSYAEQKHFKLYLRRDDVRSDRPIFHGLVSEGRASQHIPGWIDGFYGGLAFFEGEAVALPDLEAEAPLFRAIGDTLAPGGWLALAYETLGEDTSLLRTTRRLLGRGVPPIVTPLGSLLHRADCGLHIRNWYISEGWREGPRKLQGYRPSHQESRRKGIEQTVQSLRTFLEGSAESEAEVAARARARLAELVERPPPPGRGPA